MAIYGKKKRMHVCLNRYCIKSTPELRRAQRIDLLPSNIAEQITKESVDQTQKSKTVDKFNRKIEIPDEEVLSKYSMTVDCSTIPVFVQPRDFDRFKLLDEPKITANDEIVFESNMPFLRPVLIDGLAVSDLYNNKLAEGRRVIPHLDFGGVNDEKKIHFSIQIQALVRCLYYWIGLGHKTTVILPYIDFDVNEIEFEDTHRVFDGYMISDLHGFAQLKEAGLIEFINVEKSAWLIRASLERHAIVITNSSDYLLNDNEVEERKVDMKNHMEQAVIPGRIMKLKLRPNSIFHPFFLKHGDQVVFPPNDETKHPDVSQYRHLRVTKIGGIERAQTDLFENLERNQLLLIEQLRAMKFLYELMPKTIYTKKEYYALQGIISKILPLMVRELKKMRVEENQKAINDCFLNTI